MDISKLSIVSEDEGVLVHLRDVNDEPMVDEKDQPITLRVAGSYSSFYREAQRKETARSIRATQRRGPTKTISESDVEDLEGASVRVQAACIREWCFQQDGKPFPITPANWRRLLDMQPQWQAQVHAAMQEHADFFKAS